MACSPEMPIPYRVGGPERHSLIVHSPVGRRRVWRPLWLDRARSLAYSFCICHFYWKTAALTSHRIDRSGITPSELVGGVKRICFSLRIQIFCCCFLVLNRHCRLDSVEQGGKQKEKRGYSLGKTIVEFFSAAIEFNVCK